METGATTILRMKEVKKIIKPQSFEYLGKVFTPIISNEKYNFNKLASKVWGNLEEPSLQDINNKFTHEDFYKVARQNGCGRIDIFEMGGEKVIPCSRLRYFGQPNWFTQKKVEEIKAKQSVKTIYQRTIEALQDYEKMIEAEIESCKGEDEILEGLETDLLEVQDLILTLKK